VFSYTRHLCDGFIRCRDSSVAGKQLHWMPLSVLIVRRSGLDSGKETLLVPKNLNGQYWRIGVVHRQRLME
jgi:hypothetical protein